MSRHSNELYSPKDFFSHQALDLSYRLMRNNNSGLANAIKKALDQSNRVPYDLLHKAHTGEMYFNAHLLEVLNVHTIGKIVSALTEIGESALNNPKLPPESMTLLRNLIDDWVQLTEWILNNSANDKTVYN